MSGGMLALAAALGLVAAAVWLLDSDLLRPTRNGGRRVQGTRWAGRRDLRDLILGSGETGRLVLGRHGRRLLATVEQTSVVVVGPTRISYKTSGFTIPAVLEWDGPVVATSVKGDLLARTRHRREQLGETMIFDPTRVTGLGNVKATPLTGCETWAGAMRVAHLLCRSAQSSGEGLQDSAFWYAAAEKLLAPMLFAAALREGQIKEVVDWLNAGAKGSAEIERALKEHPEARGAWMANWNREERQLSSIYTTAETVLRAFADPQVLEESTRADYTPARLLDGNRATLYLCAPAQEQERLGSVFATMLSELAREVSVRSGRTGKPIEPPLLIVLDEAANTAPMPDLDGVASTGSGEGIELVTVFQDFAQVRARWGERARTILNNHQAKVFPGGISDPETLRYINDVVGDGEFSELRETSAKRGQGSSTEGAIYRSLAPSNVVREARPGTGLLIYGHRPPARIELRPWFKDPGLKAMVEEGEE